MINLGDKFILHSPNGVKHYMKIININDYREPEMKYALDVHDENGVYLTDNLFVGDKFFENNADIIEKCN